MNHQEHVATLEKQRDKMAQDMTRLTGQAKEVQHDIGQDAKNAARRAKEEAKSAVRELAGDAREVVSQAGSATFTAAKEKVAFAVRKTGDKLSPRRVAREQPWLALGLATLAGFALAWLFPRLVPNLGGGGSRGMLGEPMYVANVPEFDEELLLPEDESFSPED